MSVKVRIPTPLRKRTGNVISIVPAIAGSNAV